MTAGITGHQYLDPADIEWIKVGFLSNIIEYNVSEGIGSLAIGADQIFAATLLEQKVPLAVVIPCNNYEQTFKSPEAIDRYKWLLSMADRIVVLPFTEPSEEAFYQAGKIVVVQCDILFAVWDGKRARGWGGTGDIVKLAKQVGRKVIHFNVINKTVTVIS